MDFNYLGFVRRTLLMAKQPSVSAITTDDTQMAYKAQLSVNDVIRDLSNLLMINTRKTTFTFATVASQRVYTIQKRVKYPFINLRQKSTDAIIEQMTAEDFDFFVPDDSGTGTPGLYYLESFSGVANQPAVAGEVVYVVSSSTSDTSVVVVQGYDTSDNYIVDKITLTGTTQAASSSTFKKISSVSKIKTVGTVTFRNSGSATTYETLSPNETHSRRLAIGLHPIPGSVITIYGRGHSRVPDLVNEYDVPAGFSEDHINAIKFGAFAHFMEFDPKIPSRQIDGYYNRYYDEIAKITGLDKMAEPQPRMKPPGYAVRPAREVRALSRRIR